MLSISTAGKNRYLLHFNSHHSLIQWTAGIRLAMFEHATLQEAYTGALIAGKGKALNNIGLIMERTKIKTEDWARVRFGAGTPWRRCWCVITPPDEKEVQKLRKEVNKKKSAYDRSRPPVLKGSVKFYDTKKTKKVNPIATITEAYTAFAIYPQAKPLIDASTLVKVEGLITIHSSPPSTTEGFVFVMPEVHPAVTGFEMMLRWLFPVFDTFALYGRPARLAAETKDPQSLMFAMPKHRRYGYLEILDVSGLILETGSSTWRESEWRRRMKELTLKRMTAIEDGSRRDSRYSSRRSTRNSFGPSRSRLTFDDAASTRSSPSIGWQQGPPVDVPFGGIPRTDSAPPASDMRRPATSNNPHHNRSVSDTQGINRYGGAMSNYDGGYDRAPTPPIHEIPVAAPRESSNLKYNQNATGNRISSEDDTYRENPVPELQNLTTTTSPEPVAAPPAFAHMPGSLPATKPYHSPDLRRAKSRMSTTTLSQLAGAGGAAGSAAAAAYHASNESVGTSESQGMQIIGHHGEEMGQNAVLSDTNNNEYSANRNGPHKGQAAVINPRISLNGSSPMHPTNVDSRANLSAPPPLFSTQNTAPSHTYDQPQSFSSPNPGTQLSGHPSHPLKDSTHSAGSQPSRLVTGGTISRKPLPQASTDLRSPISAETASSTSTLDQLAFDEGAFDMVKAPIDRTQTVAGPHEKFARDRSETMSSVYEDSRYGDSEPDYASTSRPSVEYVERRGGPRTGVMRTVGTLQDVQYPNGPDPSIPEVNFGPTMNLTSDRHTRAVSSGTGQVYGAAPANSSSTAFRRTPDLPLAARPKSSGHSRSPNRNVLPNEGAHYRNDSSESRTLPWQPGMSAMGSPAAQQSITAEQFVQQRANVTPLYAHQRQSSNPRGATPPLVRNHSNDRLTQMGGHSRHSSGDLLQRPSSRGPSATLGGPAGNGDMPTTLSAREQEHVARVTGQPLIAVAGTRKSAGAGLVGAIENREIEKQQMKQGINSQAVQNAIAQRHSSHGMYQQYPPEQVNAHRMSQAQYGQYPQAQYAGQVQGHSPYMSSAANVYAQGGGFSAPSPSLYQGSPDPTFQTPPGIPGMPFSPPSQYFQQQPNQQHNRPQGGQGKGNQGYRGHY